MSAGLRFDGRRVLMTGGASGIGRATAVRLVAEGATVVAVDLDGEGLARTVAQCAEPGRITTAVCDVTSEPEVIATVARAAGDLDFGYVGRIRSLMGEATPEQIAGAIAFAASDDASYLTGAELRVDGGSHT